MCARTSSCFCIYVCVYGDSRRYGDKKNVIIVVTVATCCCVYIFSFIFCFVCVPSAHLYAKGDEISMDIEGKIEKKIEKIFETRKDTKDTSVFQICQISKNSENTSLIYTLRVICNDGAY